VRFHIQQESDIPASTQLYNQICFAIAARHYPPGHRLPSTRQLAMQTGLHRNTISKVYRQLEMDGVVEAIAGSGIYVRDNLTKRDFKKSVDFAFTDFSRTYGEAIENFFEPLLMFLVWFESFSLILLGR